jgi:sugar lactone lactonase YvrE
LLNAAQAGNATDVAVDAAGNLYISDVSGYSIHKLSPDGTLRTEAGNGKWGFAGDGTPASGSPVAPEGLAVDAAGNLYVADDDAGRVRKINATGTISTVAGNGGQWFEGDGGPAANAGLVYPSGLTFDGAGNLYTADLGGGFRKISPGGTITTAPGSPLSSAPPPPAARPVVAENAIAADRKENLYFIGTGIRSLSPDGTLTVIGGITYYYGGLAVDAADTLYYSLIYTAAFIGKRFANGVYGDVTMATGCGSGGSLGFDPSGLAIDKSGNVFAADLNGATVHRIALSGAMETIAGNFTSGYSGDGGPATAAQLNQPASIAVDAAGDIDIFDPIDKVVRVLRPSRQPPVTIAAVTNGASNLAEPIAPGEIVVIYGSGLGPEPLVACESRPQGLVSKLNETQVYFDGVPAPLI